MKLPQPREELAVFWLPDKPDDKMVGKLIISEKGEPSAEMYIHGFASHDLHWILGQRKRLILGETGTGISVTLVGSSGNGVWSIKTNEHSKVGLRADYLFYGEHYETGEIDFHSVTFSLHGLQAWLAGRENSGKTAPVVLLSGQVLDDFTINLSTTDRITWELSNSGDPVEERTQPFFITGYILEREQKYFFTEFRIESCRSRSFTEFEPVLRRVRDFLSLAFNFTPSFTYIVGSPSLDSDHDVSIYGTTPKVGIFSAHFDDTLPQLPAFTPSPRRPDHPTEPYFPITFEEVRDNFDGMLSKWLEYYNNPLYEHAFFLYFRTAPTLETPSRIALSTLMQCVEGLHRARYPDKRDEVAGQYLQRLDTLLEKASDKEFKDWVQGKMSFAAEPSLRQRMNEMMPDSFKNLYENESNKFVEDVVSVRNALAHPERKRLEKTIGNVDIEPLYHKLETFVTLFLVEKLLGIECDQNKIDIIKQGRWYSRT